MQTWMLLNLEVFLVISFSSFVPLSPLANTSFFPSFPPFSSGPSVSSWSNNSVFKLHHGTLEGKIPTSSVVFYWCCVSSRVKEKFSL